MLTGFFRRVFGAFGYRITRSLAQARFQAMDESLRRLRDAGYYPLVVIDGGANVGAWTTIAHTVFMNAKFHLVEPQPACGPALRRLAATSSGVSVYQTALVEPGVSEVRLVGGGRTGGSTGAFVARAHEPSDGSGEIVSPATTLDKLFADQCSRSDRVLLKLDLENYELPALAGAVRLLSSVEVIVTEVQFFTVNNNDRPVFADVVRFLGDRGFAVFDVAALSPRPRDQRLRQGDVVFVRHDSPLASDTRCT